MREPQPANPSNTNRNRGVFVVLALYLIATFLWRVFIPAHEYDGPFDVYLPIGLDLLAFGALIALQVQFSRLVAPGESGWQMGTVLFWAAVVASLGIFLIRFFHGQSGWWTGHLIYTLR